ncbi:SDR family NAD(P)-dependent oxidoreductase [Vibrio sp. D404a]|uniref:oxidoreductase n=1 Tax=unclassified Vibrio TaxID=2614977 RepID=UPI002554DC38|nr:MULTISPECIES: oxidoreductase [unclassified Vibrio]MDK9735705.1 SDR family NAD(P)-dependent oxidoreductase [Vibrio sp. D404a]MDK9798621.1 SDR family NAD(P)-dependent oxidoreductase [Vibrio sp. D449a]
MTKAKVIFITGASSGMGKDTAMDLIQQGHIVYCAARRVEEMNDLKLAGGYVLQLDVSNEQDIAHSVNQIIEEQGRIDVLWNNAGYGLYGSVEETSLEDARYQFEVNVFGLARLTQMVTPFMREAQSGTIINTSSIGGKIYAPMGAWYHASKHAVEGFSDCLRLELEPKGINVVVLEPGAIKTEFPEVMSKQVLGNSGHGPYQDLAKRVANLSLKESGKDGAGSPTAVISKVVQEIIYSPKPKTRYAVGKFSTTTLLMRRFLSDRIFDRIIDFMVR